MERYEKNARQWKREFNLSEELFHRLVVSPCDYCGCPPETIFRSGKTASTRDIFKYNGIDRIDSTKGYVEGNVVPCCNACNELKSDKSREKFLARIESIHRWQNRQRAASA